MVFNLENKTLYVVLSLRFESLLSEFGDVDLDGLVVTDIGIRIICARLLKLLLGVDRTKLAVTKIR